MNNARRKEIQKITQQLEELKSSIESLQEEEQDAYDNLPESIQDGARGEKMQEAINNLEYAVDNIQDCIDNLESAME